MNSVLEKSENSDIYEVSIEVNESLKSKLSNLIYKSTSTAFERILFRFGNKHNFIS